MNTRDQHSCDYRNETPCVNRGCGAVFHDVETISAEVSFMNDSYGSHSSAHKKSSSSQSCVSELPSVTPTLATRYHTAELPMKSHLFQRLFTRLAASAALMLCFGSQAMAVTENLTINVTVMIADDVNVTWCDNLGANDSDAAQVWALGTKAIATTYVTASDGTPPTLQYIQNVGTNSQVDISASCSNSYSWTAVAAVGAANQFRLRGKVADSVGYSAGPPVISGGSAYASYHTSQTDIIQNLCPVAEGVNTSVSGLVELELITPTTITRGGGLSQTIVVTYVASADNGD